MTNLYSLLILSPSFTCMPFEGSYRRRFLKNGWYCVWLFLSFVGISTQETVSVIYFEAVFQIFFGTHKYLCQRLSNCSFKYWKTVKRNTSFCFSWSSVWAKWSCTNRHFDKQKPLQRNKEFRVFKFSRQTSGWALWRHAYITSSKMAAFSCRVLGYFRKGFRRVLALVGSSNFGE